MRIMEGKWKVLLILSLYKRPLRFNKIKQVLGINSNSLATNLKYLTDIGIVKKSDDAEPEYSLTHNGISIAGILCKLNNELDRLL